MGKKTFGLTGGIACGKSAAAAVFAGLGVAVVDADQLSRDVVLPGSKGLLAVVTAFGEDVLTPEGTLDRKRLGEIVFADAEKRRALEAIMHPLIFMEGRARIEAFEASAAPYVLYEAALLVETGGYKGFDGLVVVAAHEDVQISRVMARDGLDEAGARARLAAQLPVARKVEVADVVIWNDGDLGALREAVHVAHEKLLERARGETT